MKLTAPAVGGEKMYKQLTPCKQELKARNDNENKELIFPGA